MTENLNIGTMVNGSANQLNNSIIEKYCYNNIEDSCNVYGGLYQWDEMMQYSTTPGVKGDTASGDSKPATLETGYVLQVPPFIEKGELLKIDTRTGAYVERVKE